MIPQICINSFQCKSFHSKEAGNNFYIDFPCKIKELNR